MEIEEYSQDIAQVKNAQECFITDEQMEIKSKILMVELVELYQNANTKCRMNFKEVLSRKTMINLQGLQIVD